MDKNIKRSILPNHPKFKGKENPSLMRSLKETQEYFKERFGKFASLVNSIK